MSNQSISVQAQREAEEALYGGPQRETEQGRLFWKGQETLSKDGPDTVEVEVTFYPDGDVVLLDEDNECILLTQRQALALASLIQFYRGS